MKYLRICITEACEQASIISLKDVSQHLHVSKRLYVSLKHVSKRL